MNNKCNYQELELCSACAFRFKCTYYKQILIKEKKKSNINDKQ